MGFRAQLAQEYDAVVIGGGVQGAALCLEASLRGYRVLLLEKNDFGSGVSSNSLRIIHGGLRYLQSLDFKRSRESIQAQQEFLQQSPHFTRLLPCLMTIGNSWKRNRFLMMAGMYLYDNIVRFGQLNHPKGKFMSMVAAKSLDNAQFLKSGPGVAMWYDVQIVDSERFILSCIKTAEEYHACSLNKATVISVQHEPNTTVVYEDQENNQTNRVQARWVFDTACFLKFAQPHWKFAVNLVLNKAIQGTAVAVDDIDPVAEQKKERSFFITPHQDKTIVGTWYFPNPDGKKTSLTKQEFDLCVAHCSKLFPNLDASPEDVSLVHVGRLPATDDLMLMEKPYIEIDSQNPGIVSVMGVKYTTARFVARKALDKVGLNNSTGANIKLYGAMTSETQLEEMIAQYENFTTVSVLSRLLKQYGEVSWSILELAKQIPNGFELIPGIAGIRAEVEYTIRNEYVLSLSDFIKRRSGIGSFSCPSAKTLEYCVSVIAEVKGWDDSRIQDEISELRRDYLFYEK